MNKTPFQNPGPYHNTDIGGDTYSRTGGNEGGWPSREAAMAGIAEDQRRGTVIAIRTGDEITEWWWQGGTTLAHLVPKEADLTNYYTKEETYTQEEVNNAITANITNLATRPYMQGETYPPNCLIDYYGLLFSYTGQGFTADSDSLAIEMVTKNIFWYFQVLNDLGDQPGVGWGNTNRGAANAWETYDAKIDNFAGSTIRVKIEFSYTTVNVGIDNSFMFPYIPVRYFITIPANIHVKLNFDSNIFQGDLPDPTKDWISDKEQVLDLTFTWGTRGVPFEAKINIFDNRKGIASTAGSGLVDTVNTIAPAAGTKNITLTSTHIDNTVNDATWWGAATLKIKGALDYLASKIKTVESKVLPAGGANGQVLVKDGTTSYVAKWATLATPREHYCQLDFSSDALTAEVAFDTKMSFTEFREVENATLNTFHLRLLPNELSPAYTTIAELNSAINTLYPSNPGTYFVRVVINPLPDGATTACAVLKGIETA